MLFLKTKTFFRNNKTYLKNIVNDFSLIFSFSKILHHIFSHKKINLKLDRDRSHLNFRIIHVAVKHIRYIIFKLAHHAQIESRATNPTAKGRSDYNRHCQIDIIARIRQIDKRER